MRAPIFSSVTTCWSNVSRARKAVGFNGLAVRKACWNLFSTLSWRCQEIFDVPYVPRPVPARPAVFVVDIKTSPQLRNAFWHCLRALRECAIMAHPPKVDNPPGNSAETPAQPTAELRQVTSGRLCTRIRFPKDACHRSRKTPREKPWMELPWTERAAAAFLQRSETIFVQYIDRSNLGNERYLSIFRVA